MEEAEADQTHLNGINNDFESQNIEYKDDDADIQLVGSRRLKQRRQCAALYPVRRGRWLYNAFYIPFPSSWRRLKLIKLILLILRMI